LDLSAPSSFDEALAVAFNIKIRQANHKAEYLTRMDARRHLFKTSLTEVFMGTVLGVFFSKTIGWR
jgi:hypothetical protein